MNRQDAPELIQMLTAALSLYGRTCPTEALTFWYSALEPFDLATIKLALADWTTRESTAPVPANIRKLCEAATVKPHEVWPSPDQAWAALPLDDETRSVVWCDEQAVAWGQVAELYQSDRVGARMAFREAYTSLVEQARMAGLKPRWTISRGTNQAHLADVLAEAVEAQKLPLDFALKHMPNPDPRTKLFLLSQRHRDALTAIEAAERKALEAAASSNGHALPEATR